MDIIIVYVLMLFAISLPLLFAYIGRRIGRSKNAEFVGTLLGLCLGPLGLIIITVYEPRITCPKCGNLLIGLPKECPKCLSPLSFWKTPKGKIMIDVSGASEEPPPLQSPPQPPTMENQIIKEYKKMTTEERLIRLERTNRILILVLVLVGLCVSVVLITGMGQTREVKANKFTLVNTDGNPRAGLVMTKDGPRLCLWDENGTERAGLFAAKDGPHISLWDENGKQRAGLFMTKDGPRLCLWDENGTERAGLVMTKDGPGLFTFDENGKRSTYLGTAKDGTGLRLYDENGKNRAVLVADKDGPSLILTDKDEKPCATLDVSKDGTRIFLADANGKERRRSGCRQKRPATRACGMRTISCEPTLLRPRTGRASACTTRTKRGPPDLHVNQEGPVSLNLLDKNEKGRASLVVVKAGPGLILNDENETPRAALDVFKDGPRVILYDENEQTLGKLP